MRIVQGFRCLHAPLGHPSEVIASPCPLGRARRDIGGYPKRQSGRLPISPGPRLRRGLVSLRIARGFLGSPQLGDPGAEGLAFDKLHGIAVGAAFAGDKVHRHNVGTVNASRGPRLFVETLQMSRVHCGCDGSTFSASRRRSEICSAL